MSWSYSGDPKTSDLDECRFWIQDTLVDRQLLSDEDLTYLLDAYMPEYQSVIYTSAIACEIIASRYAHEVAVSADGVSVGMGDLQSKYTQLAARLRELYKTGVTAGSVDVDRLLTDMSWDWTIPPFVFGIGHMDNVDAGEQEYGGINSAYSAPYAYPDPEAGGP
jgi:hypothetical protein